nr:C1-like protein [Tanacetum cinerariifolium]
MGEINHFSHTEHPLKLIENWETIVDDHEEKEGAVLCEGCRDPISIGGGSTYGCILCRYFLHKTCAELPPTINHKSHPFHPLTLINGTYLKWSCDAAAAALKEEASIKFEHEGHLQHTLTLKLRPAAFFCDACKTEDKDLFYECDSCDFWIHKTCASLAPTINLPHHPNHSLVLVYFLPDKFYNYPYYCEFCDKRILQNDWLYHCANCRYFAHIKCALKAEHTSVSRDPAGTSAITEEHGNDLLHFPMSYTFTDPLKLLYSGKVSSDDDEDSVEINHWSHDHPLILNVEPQDKSIMTDINTCDLIEYAALSGYPETKDPKPKIYGFNQVPELVPTINHHFHPFHLLTLIVRYSNDWDCDVCRTHGKVRGFSYYCSESDFDACTKCGVDVVSKEEAMMKLEHEGHPGHTLTLQLRRASFLCDACHIEDKDFFYQCDSCDFWIHKTCASLAPTINIPGHHHPLVLVYLLPDNFYNFKYYCEFCKAYILRNDWLYHCANCRYFAHIKCALNAQRPSTPRDDPSTSVDEEHVKDLLHFPMPYAFTDPLKLLHSGKVTQEDDETHEINHWSHPDHPIILNVEPHGNSLTSVNSGDLIELPLTSQHQLHPRHPLYLKKTFFSVCNGCHSRGNTFVYSCGNLDFEICVNCAFLPNTIKHKSHNHPLIQLIDSEHECHACYKSCYFYGMSYACEACGFHLDMHCAMRLPQSLAHRYCKGDEVLLTYPPVENHPEDFYCDICETEMHPKRPLYHCQKHKNTFHLKCLLRHDWFENTWKEGTRTISYHNHPLTFVRRKKTPKYVCSKCNQDINGFLVLECRARVCNFNICYDCYW